MIDIITIETCVLWKLTALQFWCRPAIRAILCFYVFLCVYFCAASCVINDDDDDDDSLQGPL